jgi:hypothetical protein
VDLFHVGDGHALVSSHLYGTSGVVCVGNSDARPQDSVGVGSPLSRGEDDFLASPYIPTGERSTRGMWHPVLSLQPQ